MNILLQGVPIYRYLALGGLNNLFRKCGWITATLICTPLASFDVFCTDTKFAHAHHESCHYPAI